MTPTYYCEGTIAFLELSMNQPKGIENNHQNQCLKKKQIARDFAGLLFA